LVSFCLDLFALGSDLGDFKGGGLKFSTQGVKLLLAGLQFRRGELRLLLGVNP
jgi:hypothetical protein